MQSQGQGTTIRAASVEDAAAITALSGQLGYPASETEVWKRLHVVSGCPDSAVFVAESTDGIVVGWVHVVQRELVMSDRDTQIEGLVVEETMRRKGIGQRLLAEAERWAIERGHTAIRVRSNVVRTAAHRFYPKNGYRELKRQVVYHKKLGET